MDFYTKYDHHPGYIYDSDKPSQADPQYASDCDINHIVNQALRGSVPDHLIRSEGSYGDVSEFGDFRRMMDIVDRGKSAFMDVPSEIRARFGNDPRAFFEFATNPANAPEMVKLGLAHYLESEPDVPVKVEVVSSATPKATA